MKDKIGKDCEGRTENKSIERNEGVSRQNMKQGMHKEVMLKKR